MSFQVKFSKRATKFLRKLDENILKRIKSKFKEIAKDPFRYLEHYESADCYKFRIGDYRALIDVDFKNKILWVRIIGHRKNIYKN